MAWIKITNHKLNPLRLVKRKNRPYVMGRSIGVSNSKPLERYVEVSEYKNGKPFKNAGTNKLNAATNKNPTLRKYISLVLFNRIWS